MPPNYRQQQGQPLKAHERKGAVLAAATLVAVAVGVGAWQLTTGSASAKGGGRCVDLTIASSTGGARIHACSQQARSLCAAQAKASGSLAEEIRAACRRAGFPVGS